MFPQEPYKKFAAITLYSVVGLLVLYLVFNYLWGAILPFVIAYIFAECFRPIVKYSETHKTFPIRFFILFVVLLAVGSIAMLFYGITRQIVLETGEFISKAKQTAELIRSDDAFAADVIDRINGFVPFVDIKDRLWAIRENLDAELWTMFVSLVDKLSGILVNFLGKAVAFIPNALLFTAVLIIATYYFAVDRVDISKSVLSLFPEKTRPFLKRVKETVAETVGRYLRAYGTLFFITFVELLIAFFILDVDYSFVLALVISIVDILPVLGIGTVLVPWAVIALVMGDYGFGVGLLITYAVLTVIRQVIEPKIVGKFIGLSPISALASIYIGLKLMGIAGIFVFPIGAILIKRIIEISRETKTQEKGL